MLYVVFLLLASGLCSPTDHEYQGVNVMKTWSEAQSYCREKHIDLATIDSIEDMRRLVAIAKADGITEEAWIGLKKSKELSWLWSDGKRQTYSRWTGSNSSHHCGGMDDDGNWISASCETQLPFICQSDEPSNRSHVFLEAMSWRKAQKHCRTNQTDLASVMNQTDNQALQQKISESGQASLFWIGLFRDEFKWSDRSETSFRDWSDTQPNQDGDCVLYNPTHEKWFDRGCKASHPFYCQTGEQAVKAVRIVKVEIKASSFNESLSEGILAELRKKLKEANLQWRVQPDGKIFHKKEKEKKTTERCNEVP